MKVIANVYYVHNIFTDYTGGGGEKGELTYDTENNVLTYKATEKSKEITIVASSVKKIRIRNLRLYVYTTDGKHIFQFGKRKPVRGYIGSGSRHGSLPYKGAMELAVSESGIEQFTSYLSNEFCSDIDYMFGWWKRHGVHAETSGGLTFQKRSEKATMGYSKLVKTSQNQSNDRGNAYIKPLNEDTESYAIYFIKRYVIWGALIMVILATIAVSAIGNPDFF